MPWECFGERQVTSQNIALILPAYNEEVSIGSIVLLAEPYVDRVIVVDDGSSDRTAEVAAFAGAEVLVHPLNLGKGMAFKTGFEAAGDADIIVTMDSDGQHNPADIPRLVFPILRGEADIVNGIRYLNGHVTEIPVCRPTGQAIPDKATVMDSGLKITDSQSGFRAFAASAGNVFNFNSGGMAIESWMLADAGRHGLKVKEVPIGAGYDVDGSTENSERDGRTFLLKVFTELKSNKPLYHFLLPGFLLGVIGLSLGFGFLQTFYAGGNLNFWLVVLMILLTLAGTFMVFTGAMLHSKARLSAHPK